LQAAVVSKLEELPPPFLQSQSALATPAAKATKTSVLFCGGAVIYFLLLLLLLLLLRLLLFIIVVM
jgi:hypothetical protein